jgi:hypothetical protein
MRRICFAGARSRLFLLAFIFLTTGDFCGCGGAGVKLGKVTGKVTLAGQPLPDALVMFSPANGSPSAARTSADGSYNLVYSKKINGAVLGEHTVTISTLQEPLEDPPTAGVPEKVPFKYREGEDLPKVTVKSGSNKMDFALEAGPIQPPPPPKGKKKAAEVICY